jgi:hypothetical protein
VHFHRTGRQHGPDRRARLGNPVGIVPTFHATRSDEIGMILHPTASGASADNAKPEKSANLRRIGPTEFVAQWPVCRTNLAREFIHSPHGRRSIDFCRFLRLMHIGEEIARKLVGEDCRARPFDHVASLCHAAFTMLSASG